MYHTSIIIVNYNSDNLTTACLKSLSKVTSKLTKFAVFVVDNGSNVPYQLPPSFAQFATVLRSTANLGYTGGNNLGIHEALEQNNSDFIVLLNNDTTVEPHFLDILLQNLVTDERAGMACPKIFFSTDREYHAKNYEKAERGSVLWFAGGSIDWFNLLAFHRGVDEVDRGHISKTDNLDFATGCCVAIKREVLEKVGLLDKRYFLYFEDVEWSMKTRLFGYNILYCPEAEVWHENAGSSDGAGSEIHQYYQSRNRLLFFWERGTSRTKATVVKLLLRFLVSENKMERIAAQHFIMRQFGKQPII